MSSGRLQQQFIRLWQCCDGKSQETTLNELAEMLSCSRRHMRTLLNMMESRGWPRQAFAANLSLYRPRPAAATCRRSP
jgi:MarR-like DNA-binding transcriptional regulator SgrR of sgrS sRNA